MIALLLGLSLGSGQAPGRGPEGPLRNDAFVALDGTAAAALAQGDGALALADAGRASPDTLRLAQALDAWRAACELAPEGASVPLDLARFREGTRPGQPDPLGDAARRTEAVPYAVLRRLAALDPGSRAAWEQRFGALALERLGSAGGDPERLAALERTFPGTRGAARAALVRGDQELEAGRGFSAAAWLERAAAHAGSVGEAEILAAVGRRRTLARDLLAPDPAAPGAAWESARGLGSPETLTLPALGGRAPASRRAGAALGLLPLEDGRLALVGPDRVWLRDEGGPARGFEPSALLRSHGLAPLPLPGPGVGPRIPNLPRGDGAGLFLIHGRADPLLGLGNALLAVRPPRGLGLPELTWALGPFGWARPGEAPRPLADILGVGLWEFQPGVLRVDDVLYAQARRFDLAEPGSAADGAAQAHAAEAWLLALGASDGLPRWARFLGQGVEVSSAQADRHGSGRPVRSPPEALTRAGARLFAGTGLGFGALVEPGDGRVAWTFLPRRRRAEEAGWRGGSPPPTDSGANPPRLFWAPGDSDHLYLLRAEPDLDGAGLLLATPDPIGQGEEVIGGRGAEALVLSRVGPRRTLEERDLERGARRRSLLLRPGERFLGGALVSPQRVVLASDRGLYLFDRGEGLRLLAQSPFELGGEDPRGGIFARGPRVWVLADATLLGFTVE